jgi:Skp family chaperone for outer membrane proteins
MKSRAFITVLIITAVLFIYGYQPLQGQSDDIITLSEIGVVNISEVFEKSQRNEDYVQKLESERQDIVSRLDKLQKEIETTRSGLQTLKQGSEDRLERIKQLLEKEAKLEAQKEFYKQKLELKNQQWMEKLYKDVLGIVNEVASEKDLEIVLEDSPVSLPAANSNELMLSIRTNKVLYSDGCVNITQDVIDKLDIGDSN